MPTSNKMIEIGSSTQVLSFLYLRKNKSLIRKHFGSCYWFSMPQLAYFELLITQDLVYKGVF